jgi:hypothetical protein
MELLDKVEKEIAGIAALLTVDVGVCGLTGCQTVLVYTLICSW